MNKNLQEWACSFSGCDGGNLGADIWLCGIEWGGASYGDYYEKTLPEELENGKVELSLTEFDWKDSLGYTYGRSFAKLFTSIQGGDVENYKEVSLLEGNELFKLNLYPIAFDSTDHELWHKNNISKLTGFENKYLFNTWCFFNRFPFFSELRKKHNPKLIIGTGVNYLRDFLMFFAGNEKVGRLCSGNLTPKSEANKTNRVFYWVKLDGGTLLVIIPFFSGRYGLNSNYLLQEMGQRIKLLLEMK
ncbi:hypothetical protein CMT41_14885 [Colwellia sp. MT41]|uniref:hypothetical protein n=1 Tax=Colwellia sp. MT41 TaxID=58049 RepID=UPI000717A243|nr:hypothetical protein [Colwellia sp. MT41]ALO35863.1 hypothetical protein CMT41_14885 [Colwellia sp. MT41]